MPTTCYRQLIVASAIAVASAAAAVPVSAQGSSSTIPAKANVAEPATPSERSHSLTLSATAAQAYDDDVPREVAGVVDPSVVNVGGHSTMFSGGLDYSMRMGQMRAGVNADTSYRYYASVDEFKALSHSAAVGLSGPVSRRTSLFVSQTVAYSPSYLYGLFPQQAAEGPVPSEVLAPNYFIDDYESITYGTNGGMSRALSRRSSVTVSGDLTGTRFLKETASQRNLRVFGTSARYTHGLARNSSLHAGYRYRQGDFNYSYTGLSTEPSAEHTFDVGIDYSRPLSRTRRVSVGASLGPSILTMPSALSSTTGVSGHTHSGLAGQASISFQMSRSWLARGNYRRGVEYVAGLVQPVLADSASASVAGFLTRQMEFTSSFGYSNGHSAQIRTGQIYATYTGDMKLQYALNGKFALFAEYLYYYYQFDTRAQLAPTVPVGLERDGIHAGITLRVPIISR